MIQSLNKGKKGWPWTEEVSARKYSGQKKWPSISVIMPSFNQRRFLEEAIRSVVLQNYPSLNFIIIDGGSTDGSTTVIEHYAKHLSYWCSEKDHGTYDALNKALGIMKGEYWMVVNSDDLLLKDAMFEIGQFIFQNPDEKWFTAGVTILNANSEARASMLPKPPPPVAGKTFLNRCWIYHASTVLHNSIYHSYGGFDASDIMDYAYWLKLESSGLVPRLVDGYFAGLRFHPECKSWDNNSMNMAFINLLEDYSKRLDKDNQSDLMEIRNKVAQLKLANTYLNVKERISEGKRMKAFLLMFRVATIHPMEVLGRYYWAVFSRIFRGLNRSEFSPHQYLN